MRACAQRVNIRAARRLVHACIARGNMEAEQQSSSESESMRESEDETTEDVGPIKKKQKLTRKYQGSALYVTKYQSSWEKVYTFVSPSSSSKCHFHCKVCNKDVSVSHQGALDIQRHAEGKTHKQRMAALRTQPQLSFKPSSDPVHTNAIAAEVRNTVMFAHHNTALCLADHIGPMQRKNYIP